MENKPTLEELLRQQLELLAESKEQNLVIHHPILITTKEYQGISLELNQKIKSLLANC